MFFELLWEGFGDEFFAFDSFPVGFFGDIEFDGDFHLLVSGVCVLGCVHSLVGVIGWLPDAVFVFVDEVVFVWDVDLAEVATGFCCVVDAAVFA